MFLAPFYAKFLVLFTDEELPSFPVRLELRTLRDSASNKAVGDVIEIQLLSDSLRGDLPILLYLADDHLIFSGSRFFGLPEPACLAILPLSVIVLTICWIVRTGRLK